MGYKRTYTYNKEKFNGSEPCDILLELYDNDSFRTIGLRVDDQIPWKICDALNHAYQQGRKDAMSDLRVVLGIKE